MVAVDIDAMSIWVR